LNLPKRGEFVLERGNSKYKGILMSLLWGRGSKLFMNHKVLMHFVDFYLLGFKHGLVIMPEYQLVKSCINI
jgi:hypothetical protein